MTHARNSDECPAAGPAGTWPAELRRALGTWPSVGIVLGSGLGRVVDVIEPVGSWSFAALPGVAAPSAAGHAGRLVAGRFGSVGCIVAQGRLHLYEGHSVEAATALVRCLAAAQVETLILTNAAGGLHPEFRQGDLMIVTDHLDLMFRPPRGETVHVRHRPVYDPGLVEELESAAVACRFAIRKGVYAGMLGPTYETRAEYRMLRRLGADAVGMSTIPEAIVASRLGARVAALSVITNEAKPDCPDRVSHEEVVDWTGRASQRVGELLRVLLSCESVRRERN